MTNNVADGSARDAKHIAKLVLGECVSGIQSPDLGNLGFVKLGLWQHLTMRTAAFGTTFDPHIFNILVIRTKPDVRRIHAFSVVARMAGKMTFWYWAVNKFVAQAMRQYVLARNPDLSITMSIKSGFPLPTVSWAALVHFFPETLKKSWGELRGMIVHSNSLLSAVAHATGHSQCRGGNFIGLTSIIPQLTPVEKVV